ncbi:MAG: hypothetical protein KatS3mg087_1300 [Patescibacteria group bacterium]|nr:MAG: hypothetical protein KatS3mg087_1300 [Patescibacteria group bacterium]
MALSYDTPITTDADLYNIAFEQEITNILREAGKTNFNDLHKAAVNALIVEVKRRGLDPTKVTNTQDLKEVVVFDVLRRIYRAEMLSGRHGAASKYEFYTKEWERLLRNLVIEQDSLEETVATPAVSVYNTGEWEDNYIPPYPTDGVTLQEPEDFNEIRDA